MSITFDIEGDDARLKFGGNKECTLINALLKGARVSLRCILFPSHTCKCKKCFDKEPNLKFEKTNALEITHILSETYHHIIRKYY